MIISKRRKRPALKTKVVRRIEEIPPDEWDKIFPDVPENYDFFKTLDESNLRQFSFYYIMVYDHEIPVGATTCFLMNYSLDTSIRGPLKRIVVLIKKLMPDIFKLKALICGAPIAPGRIGVAGRADAALKAILRRMESIAKKNRAPIIAFKDFNHSYANVLDPLKEEGFSKFDSLPLAGLSIHFKDFEGYINTLSSANRYGLRRKFKKVDDRVAIDMQVLDTLTEDVLHDVYRLYLNTETRYGVAFELLPVEFFRNISRYMPEKTKYFIWRIDGKLVMFLLGMVSEDVFIDYNVGFDYSVAHKYHLYFVQFRDALSWCIKNGIKKYDMGVTGYETKRRLGFGFTAQHIYVKLRNKGLRRAFNLICQLLKFENFDPALEKLRISGMGMP